MQRCTLTIAQASSYNRPSLYTPLKHVALLQCNLHSEHQGMILRVFDFRCRMRWNRLTTQMIASGSLWSLCKLWSYQGGPRLRNLCRCHSGKRRSAVEYLVRSFDCNWTMSPPASCTWMLNGMDGGQSVSEVLSNRCQSRSGIAHAVSLCQCRNHCCMVPRTQWTKRKGFCCGKDVCCWEH